MPPKLGILAGGGALPLRLIDACKADGREFFVVALKDQADQNAFNGVPHEWVRLGAAGKALDLLRKKNVEELVLAGSVKRPSLTALRPDPWGLKLLTKAGVNSLGDDGLLTTVIKELEKEGFRIVGAEDVMSSLLAVEKVYGNLCPDETAQSDIEKGFEVAEILGRADVGQAVVIQQGLVLAVEAIEGTEEMLKRVPSVSRDGPKGILIKTSKPNQERRADLPTVGTDTVRQAYEAGLRGIAVEATGALVIDPVETAVLADELGLFVIGQARRGRTSRE